ncbi:MAG: MM0924 family protein [Candidatus Methanomethylicaceae archaeon]
MEKFISEHLIGQQVNVYYGSTDKFTGKVVACADGVLTLETGEGIYTHISVDKIVALWKKDQPWFKK